MSTLHSHIQLLTADFCDALLVAVRGASIEELTGDVGIKLSRVRARDADDTSPAPRTEKKTGKGGRLARRSEEDIARVVQDIVACVSMHPEGIRAEELRAELGLEKNEIGKPIMSALDSGLLRKEGWKRATCYFVGKKGGAAKSAKTAKAGAKPAKKTKKKVAAAPKKKAASKARAKVKAAPKKKKPAAKAKAAPKKAKAVTKSAKKADKTANGATGPSMPAASSEATA